MKLFAPGPVASAVKASLLDPVRPCYGQVATVDAAGRPQVRTVHLRWLAEKGTLGFSTHAGSPKWSQLRGGGRVSGLFWDAPRLLQWRFSGRAELLDARSGEDALLDRMWRLMRPDVRKAYWKDCPDAPRVPDVFRRAPSLGVVICRPELWDVFAMDLKDYTRSRRRIYVKRGAAWGGRLVSPLHGGYDGSRS